MPVQKNGREIFNDSDINNPDIDGGTADNTTINNSIIGKSTPAELWGSPSVSKGPAIDTSFTGADIVTASASTTVVFGGANAAANAIKAGYSATNPILGTTLISNALTRYIVSWTNATTCVVDSSVTWAGTAITSVQLPIATLVASDGTIAGWVLANKNVYFVGNMSVGTAASDYKVMIWNGSSGTQFQIGAPGSGYYFRLSEQEATVYASSLTLNAATENKHVIFKAGNIERARIDGTSGNILTGGLTAAGGTAQKVIAMANTANPATAIVEGAQFWPADRDGVAGDGRLHIMGEKSTATVIIGDGQVEFNAPANGKGTGIVVYRQAGENLVFKDSCYIKTDGKMWKTDADSYTTMPTTRIALETISADAWGLFLEYGYMRDDTWTWTMGGTIYADTTTGAWTQTAVSGQSDVLQIIGTAESATVAKINPSWVTTEIGLDVVTVSSADAAITVSSLTSVPVQYHVTTGNSDRTLTIDAMSAADIGKGIEIYKVDPGGSGKVIVTAPAGVYFVNSAGASTAGGTITSEASKYQMVSLRFISATLIQIKYTDGTWTKSS